MTEGVPFSLLPILLVIRFLILLRFLLLLVLIRFLVSSFSSTSLAHPAYLSSFSYVSSLLLLLVMLLPSPTFHAPSIFLATLIVLIKYGSFFSPICFRTLFSSPQSSSTHLSLSSPPLPSLRPPPLLPVRIAIQSHRVVRRRQLFPRPRDRPQRGAPQQRGFHGGLYSPWLPFPPRGRSSQVGAWLLLQRMPSWREGSHSQLHRAPAPAASSASHGAFGPLVALRGDAGGNTGGER